MSCSSCGLQPYNSRLVSHSLVIMPWLEWCPAPQQPGHQWIKIFHPGSWTPQDERDEPPPRHTYREWKEFIAPNPTQDQGQPIRRHWYKRDWTTEGYKRVAAPEPAQDFHLLIPPQQTVATQSSDLTMTPQMLNVILQSSEASSFSFEDLTRLHEGIGHQLSKRARLESHHSAPASLEVAPPEHVEAADLSSPADQPGSSNRKAQPIFEIGDA